jgi:GH18 family chitinase
MKRSTQSALSPTRRPCTLAAILSASCILLSLIGCSDISKPVAPRADQPRLVGYLPDWDQSYAYYATSLNFSRMTHLILAFGLAPLCNGTCTSTSDMTISLNQSDAEIAALVTAAHKADVKVLISIGGGDLSADSTISQFYNAGLSSQFASSIESYLTAHDLDGLDVDMEDPNNLGQPYADFVSALSHALKPSGKLLTAAMAQYLQSAIPDSVLGNLDFINVMTYSKLADAVSDLDFYSQQKKVPVSRLVLGVPFFGQSADGAIDESYATILSAYPNAWKTDQVSGGKLDGGITLYYVGETTMATETKLGAQYGGIMIWELTGDAAPPHSLLGVIRSNL